ncbi:prostate stem cell antigen [Thamnophis elegans]|uniref:prostate stem cell antigen n=1 Tax=Thamnophis elegans TaxID=35005 RepID=UPI0013784AF1|nr:prostate stem cell antigen [Thamnophis elegans]
MPYDARMCTNGPVSSNRGGSLWCYTCRIQLYTDKCKTTVFCKGKTKQICKTDVISLMGFVSIISKECASSCNAYYKDISIAKRNISCCSNDLCNIESKSSSSSTLRAQIAMVVFTSLVCMILSRAL